MAELLLVLLGWAGRRRAAGGATRPPVVVLEVEVLVGMVLGPPRDMLVRGRIDKSEIFQTGVNTWRKKEVRVRRKQFCQKFKTVE